MTNWEKYFGTPEKAAETIEDLCENAKGCGACPLLANGKQSPDDGACGDPLKWLMADAEADFSCKECEI